MSDDRPRSRSRAAPPPPPIGEDDPSVEQMAGQMVVAGFEGDEALPTALSEMLEGRHLGGVILFARNIRDPQAARALSDAAVGLCPDRLPPIVCVDQEGGRVQRFKAPFTELPPARAVGSTGDPALAYKWGKLLATELVEVGVNLDLAPVMDVDTNPDSPVIGDRSLSGDPEVVARLGMAMALGMQQRGVGACAKHFPGHGDATVDSHEDLPVLDLDAKRLKKVELAPFQRAASGGVAAVMAGHLKVPSLDPELPATLSKAMITGLLRERWKFEGVVITDDMEMGAIDRHYRFGHAVELGVEAGVDVFLVCKDLDKTAEAVDRIVAWGKRGKGRADRLRRSYERIMQLKRAYRFPGKAFDGAALGQVAHQRLVEVVREAAAQGPGA